MASRQTECGIQGLLSFGTSSCNALETCYFHGAWHERRAWYDEHVMPLCCVTSPRAPHVTRTLFVLVGNKIWGALGAKSMADLFHRAPVLQTVYIQGTIQSTSPLSALSGSSTKTRPLSPTPRFSSLVSPLTSMCPVCVVCRAMVCPDCNFGEAGWRVILQALTTAPHNPKEVVGLGRGFVIASDFDPAAVLRDLKWPVDLLQQIPQFCRSSHPW